MKKKIAIAFFNLLFAIPILVKGQWDVSNLSQKRYSLAATTVTSQILFGGGVNSGYSDVVYILNSSSNVWTTAHLSEPRKGLAAISGGTKAFFAGGVNSNGVSNVIDIFDSNSSSWSTANLSEKKMGTCSYGQCNEGIFCWRNE